jgi:hypothetical protein
MNRRIYNHAECFMRRFKLKISASGTVLLKWRSCICSVSCFLHFIFKSTQHAAVQYECYFRQFTGSPLKQYVFMKIPIIELFKIALDMSIWHLLFCFFQKSYLRPEGKIQAESTSQSGHDFRS